MEKIQSTSEQITSKLKHECQCMLDATYITAAQLSCDPEETSHIIFRARLSSTPDASNAELSSILENWVTSGAASVTLEHIQLNLDPSCAVVINALNDPICPVPITTEPPNTNQPSISAAREISSNLYIYIGSVVGFAVVVFIVVICAFVIYHRRFARYNA